MRGNKQKMLAFKRDNIVLPSMDDLQTLKNSSLNDIAFWPSVEAKVCHLDLFSDDVLSSPQKIVD